MTVSNPILPGFHPDPSICRVGEDYYLVTSTFAYFPGIPVYHSRDLARWNLIGHVLDRPSQLDLDGVEVSEGIFAPTLRHHAGTWYVVGTNVTKGGSFVVTAADPAGPWSDPTWLPEAPGIDPSLFFDEDGRGWYCGTRPRTTGTRYPGDWEIWAQEFDPKALRLVGEPWTLWHGALNEVIWPEGPHLYRRGGWYYLLAAEGGTGRDHAVTVARSPSLRGPWVGKPANPILTHRDLGATAALVNVGHADLVEAPDGSWWMVVLGSRPQGGPFCNLGRETFLVPLAWEDGWPVAHPGIARVTPTVDLPWAPQEPNPPKRLVATQGPADAVFLRTPRTRFWNDAQPDRLGLQALAARPGDRSSLSFLGWRQEHHDFVWTAWVDFVPAGAQAAGLLLFQNDDFHYRLELGSGPVVRLVVREAGEETLLAAEPVPPGRLVLEARALSQSLRFTWSHNGTQHVLAKGVDGRLLSTERAGGFVGTILGLFATGGGQDSESWATFSQISYFEN